MTDRPDPTWYLEADDGRIAWTPAGLAELGPHFARAGIDIRAVRTRDQLRQAWRVADKDDFVDAAHSVFLRRLSRHRVKKTGRKRGAPMGHIVPTGVDEKCHGNEAGTDPAPRAVGPWRVVRIGQDAR